MLLSTFDSVSGFITPNWRIKGKVSYLHATSPKAEFELQEIKAQLNAMLKQGIRPKMLDESKRNEVESYLQSILRLRPSTIPLKSLADNEASLLHGKWTMAFSSENEGVGGLPRDATVEINIQPNYKCDYKITYSKTLGMKSLTAKSSYIVDSSVVNPGLVTIIYQDIVVDAFGVNVPVGAFGMLKGRATYIDTKWFDGSIWVDRGNRPDGTEYYNIYVKN